ncbi:MAG: desulfoferrodoxin [Candidatus Delongbacteria bacterium]|jgi:superoxide reductase|nr:desulfoferrodoxin [Candidatus Delongbacteria bacterium]
MATEKKQIYRCEVCGIVAEVIGAGEGTLVCCGQDMKLLKEKTVDGAKEKHVPIVEEVNGGIKVKVGEVSHPMEDTHWIEMIEVIAKDGIVYRKDLNPGDLPEAVFPVSKADVEIVREECNKHGLWKA